MKDNSESNSGIRPGVIIAILAVLALVIGAAMLGRRKPPAPVADTVEVLPPEESVATAPVIVETRPPAPVRIAPPARPAPAPAIPPASTASIPAPAVVPAVPDVTGVLTNWEQRIDGILGDDQTDEARKASDLLAIFPNLPEDAQIEAIQHISNLLPDEAYSSLTPMMTNSLTSEHVLEVLLTDALNRPDNLKLPVLLQLARTPDHPKAAEARDILEVYVDDDLGTDWAKWEAAVQNYLRENPE
jgi:hypothetical protein